MKSGKLRSGAPPCLPYTCACWSHAMQRQSPLLIVLCSHGRTRGALCIRVSGGAPRTYSLSGPDAVRGALWAMPRGERATNACAVMKDADGRLREQVCVRNIAVTASMDSEASTWTQYVNNFERRLLAIRMPQPFHERAVPDVSGHSISTRTSELCHRRQRARLIKARSSCVPRFHRRQWLSSGRPENSHQAPSHRAWQRCELQRDQPDEVVHAGGGAPRVCSCDVNG